MDLIAIVVVVLVTCVAVVAGFYAYGMSNLREIKQNWVQYRCNPLYMPLASAVGGDVFTNFTHCTMQSVQSNAGFVLDPIYQNFSMFTDIFQQILDSMQSMRKSIAGTTDAFLFMVASIFGKITNTLGVTALLVGRIRTMMNRLISVFVVMMHIAVTGIESGTSLKNGPIGKTAEFLCFDPFTPIRLASGQIFSISQIDVGDVLEDGSKVLSKMVFDGSETPMVYVNSIRVSGNHKVLYEGKWIHCSEHPEAIPVSSCELMCCLTTDSHLIPILGNIYRDYEETDDVEEFYQDVAEYHNSAPPPLRNIYRTTGFHPLTNIRMEDGSLRTFEELSIGDRVAQGGRIIGLLVHKMNEAFSEPERDIYTAPGTIRKTKKGLELSTTPTYDPTIHPESKIVCVNLLTENALVVAVDIFGNDHTFLDDQEIPDTSIHEKRDQKVLGR